MPVFFSDPIDYLKYLECLKKAAEKHACRIHAYVLMNNHVHLLLTPNSEDSVGKMFQGLGGEYTPYINRKYRRCGSLWEGRHKGNIIESSRYLLTVMRYIEMNPVRAGMVGQPAEYRWSSYAVNAMGAENSLLSPTEEYLALGQTARERCTNYRSLFEDLINVDEQDSIHKCLNSGTPVGSDEFMQILEDASGRKAGYPTRGRPAKKPAAVAETE